MKSLQWKSQVAVTILGVSLLALSGCTRDPNANHPPEIKVKTKQFVNKGESVQLKAVVTDADKEEQLSYLWRMNSRPQGSHATLSSKDQTSSSFIADKVGTYQLDFSANDSIATVSKVIMITASSLEGEWKVDLAKSKKKNKLNSTQTIDLIELLSSNYKVKFLEDGKIEGEEGSSWRYNKSGLYQLNNKEGEKSDIHMINAQEISLMKKLPDGTEVTCYYNRIP